MSDACIRFCGVFSLFAAVLLLVAMAKASDAAWAGDDRRSRLWMAVVVVTMVVGLCVASVPLWV